MLFERLLRMRARAKMIVKGHGEVGREDDSCGEVHDM